MTLIDTSAWIEFFRLKGNPSIKALVRDLMAIKEAAYTCPVAFELLTGARKEERDDLSTALDLASRVILLPKHWDLAGSSNAALRAKGFNLPPTDLLIATVAFTEKVPLLTCDNHFTIIRDQILQDLVLA